MGNKNGTEAKIHARLRELTDEVRRLRAELSDDRRRPVHRDRMLSQLRENPTRRKREE